MRARGMAPLLLACLMLGACASSAPLQPPAHVDLITRWDSSQPWARAFSAGHTLELAVALQSLAPEQRASTLRRFAAEKPDDRTVFALCRMLFQARPGETFRHPMVGAAVFLDSPASSDSTWESAKGTYRRWPLDPITIWEGVPIIVVLGYNLGGIPESVESYVNYCLTECRDTDTRFERLDPGQIADRINRFLDLHPGFRPYRDDLLRQAEPW